MSARLAVSPELLERYSTSAPRYTSYPTAVDWQGDFEPASYPERLANAATSDDPISLYVHVPYCAELCLFCGCNVQISRSAERRDRYLETLGKELETVAASGIGARPVHQLHWGGGTPTSLDPRQIERLFEMLTQVFTLADDAEVALEVDPRVTTEIQVELLGQLGFNRISMGVQDFDSLVQKGVKRVQSEDQTRALVEWARVAGMSSVNIDLMYGLPHQTRAGFAHTVETILELRPERVALFHYAHVPWMKRHQTALDTEAMPDPETKLEIFIDALEAFDRAGYAYLGLDHFALPDDELAVAAKAGALHRNFMGYTTRRGREMVSLGVSSIGEVDGCYVQNVPQEPAYIEAVRHDGFATLRGYELTPDDRLRRDVILGLMCNGRLEKAAIEADHGIDFDATFAAELAALAPLAADGLVRLEPSALRLTPVGQVLMRNVASVFDRFHQARIARGESGRGTFSKTL